MTGKKLITNIISAAVILVLALLGYRLFFASSEETAPGLTAESDGLSSSPADLGLNNPDQEFLAVLNSLKTLDLESDIFNDPVFRGLTDFSQPLKPEPSGRRNPFDPFNPNPIFAPEVVAGTSTTATSTP